MWKSLLNICLTRVLAIKQEESMAVLEIISMFLFIWCFMRSRVITSSVPQNELLVILTLMHGFYCRTLILMMMRMIIMTLMMEIMVLTYLKFTQQQPCYNKLSLSRHYLIMQWLCGFISFVILQVKMNINTRIYWSWTSLCHPFKRRFCPYEKLKTLYGPGCFTKLLYYEWGFLFGLWNQNFSVSNKHPLHILPQLLI